MAIRSSGGAGSAGVLAQAAHGVLPVRGAVVDRQDVQLGADVAGDVADGAQAAGGVVEVLLPEEGRDGGGGEDRVHEDVVGEQGRPVQVAGLGEVPAGRLDPGRPEGDARTPAAAAQGADHHSRELLVPVGASERLVQDLLGRGRQGRREPAPLLQHGQGGAQIAGPEPERGEPAAVVVHQVLQVEERPSPAAKRRSRASAPGCRL